MNRWWIKLARYALPQARTLAVLLLLTFLGVGLGILVPWPLKLIVDYVLPGKPLPEVIAWVGALPGAGSASGQLLLLAAATVGIFLLYCALHIVQSYLEAGVGSRMAYDLAADVFGHLQNRSLLFHGRQHAGDLVRRVTADTGCVQELVLRVYLPLITSAITILSTFFVMWQLSRILALFAIGLTLPLAVLVRVFARSMSERKYQEWEVQGEIASLAEQTLTAIPMIQAFGREKGGDRRFRRLAGKTVQATLRSEISQHQFKVATGAVNAVATAIVIAVGGIAVLNGGLSVGGLWVLLCYFLALYSPIETLAYLSEGFASASAGARRVLEILESNESDVVDYPGARPFARQPAGEGVCVRMKNITFGYEPDRPVLQNVSLVAWPGEVVACVGPTGAGKSTLASLIPRLFDPWQGSVYFNDAEIREIQLASLRKQIALVPQEPFLLPLTIAENIAYGRPEASRDEIAAAAAASRAAEFIERLPRGYDTVIGERGVTLSGGERQRLSIARALLKDAPVLILDEPTSALDAQTEAGLMEAIKRLMNGRTTFIIAHRLSTIRRADQILFLEHGRTVERGTHDELLALGGSYARFYEAQVLKPAMLKAVELVEKIA